MAPEFRNILSELVDPQFTSHNSQKYGADETVFRDKNEVCPICGDLIKFIVIGENNPVEQVCKCQTDDS